MGKKTKVCSLVKSDSKIKVEENGRKAVFNNIERQDFTVSEVDGCLITDGPRADYLVSKNGSTSVLVELKGRNVEHACDQLFASLEHDNVQNLLEGKLGLLIICRKFPRFDTYVAKAKTKCARTLKAGFHVVCDKGEFDIERVAAINGPY